METASDPADQAAAEIVAALRPMLPANWKRPDRLGFERDLRTAIAARVRVERERAAAEALEALDR